MSFDCEIMSLLPISIYPVESKPFGLAYSEWTIKWWQWILSIPKSQNPANDDTGAFAGGQQDDGNVFFLCQTIETAKKIPWRTITLPADKSIFMPIINWISIQVNNDTDDEMLKDAIMHTDEVANMQFTLDDEPVQNLRDYRVVSPFFDVIFPEDNVFNVSPGSHRCVSDGFWIFFKPLKKIAKLSSFGSCSSGVTKISANYYFQYRLT
jgi:hypothetical protein